MNTQTCEAPKDWHPADVCAALRKRGTSLRQIAKANGYTHIQAVLTRPWWVVEHLVAEALGVRADQIWPTRYADGVSREHAKKLTRNRKALKQANRSERAAA
ncbi:helix-turn-helix domain-containing protein [Pseudacidovorax intermedius]|uniref:helix-turn-helix domain-containing protein n=1 Tax=Pseudacidovorax intermedius TaxID=433924 RepID=UPI0026F2A3F0|nr:helix-turn-helix domain-containing protein [Pseudacidovorax intermedius]